MTTKKALTYASSGVNYDSLDYLKRLAQVKAKDTAGLLEKQGMREVSASRGESAYVWEVGDTYWAQVIEGLGTKNLVADATRSFSGKSHYDAIAQDTVAMIVNDLIVVGAQPLVVNAYFAVGNSEWFRDEDRTKDLVEGWARACELSGASWGGGETPTLKEIIEPTTIDLAGSCVGIINPKERLVLGDKLAEGDAIILIESSGIHANGLTLARTLADQLPEGYATKLSNGTTYGEALLTPTHIYAAVVADLFAAGVAIHYMVNITGHGWRKLMRANETFSYILHTLPEPQPLFHFMQEQSGNSDQEMYGTFNMGAGFALYVPADQTELAQSIITKHNLKNWLGGSVKKGPKQVVLEPKNITFAAESLAVR